MPAMKTHVPNAHGKGLDANLKEDEGMMKSSDETSSLHTAGEHSFNGNSPVVISVAA